ncbi:nucleoporin NDC1 [Phymastichus coffea]|uniref:nucleoporin NDC1 n=1 Tax=Phymastichus coffea TaxID=108790 RepID=UPI00273C537A|nr:nucleoporin NDC1 [Phymastichus coffea]
MEKVDNVNKATCRELLVRRMFLAIGASIVVHFLLMSVVLLITNLKITHPLQWLQNTWNVITCLRMWTCFFVFSLVVFLNGIVSSKDYMNPTSYASSRFVKFCQIFIPHNFMLGSIYIILGGALAWLHLSVEGGRFGSLVRSCEKIQGYCLVEEHYFLLLNGLWIGLYFFTNSSYLGTRILQFPIIPQSKLSQVRRGIRIIIGSTMMDALWPTMYFMIFYVVFGNYCRHLFTTPFHLSIEEEPLDHISRLLTVSIIFYAWLHAVLFVLIVQSMHLFFQAYLTQWVSFNIEKNHYGEKGNICLSDALAMDIPILQKLGYLDLINIAQKDKNRRAVLFTLSQPGGHPYNWNSIYGKCMTLLKNFCNGINAACSTQKEQEPIIKNPIPILKNSGTGKPHTYHMRSLVSPATPCSAKIEEKQVPAESFITQYLKKMKESVVNYLLSKRLISFIFAEQFESKLRHVFNEAQAVIWAADSISSLAAVSLEEDPYGIVQKDISEIIKVFLSLKQSLDKLQKLNVSIRKPVSDDRFLKQTLTGLRSAVRRSLYRIISHFRNYIDDLALSPGVADQLQPFFTYKE